MTFDELWRLDLARQRADTNPASKARVDDSHKLSSVGASRDDPDEVEIGGYLFWLEESFLQDWPAPLR
jgi:hypothetical protein